MSWVEAISLILEATLPILLGLLSRNTKLTKRNLENFDALQAEWRAEMFRQSQKQAELTQSVQRNDDDIKQLINIISQK